jgi:hypothetical protein
VPKKGRSVFSFAFIPNDSYGFEIVDQATANKIGRAPAVTNTLQALNNKEFIVWHLDTDEELQLACMGRFIADKAGSGKESMDMVQCPAVVVFGELMHGCTASIRFSQLMYGDFAAYE